MPAAGEAALSAREINLLIFLETHGGRARLVELRGAIRARYSGSAQHCARRLRDAGFVVIEERGVSVITPKGRKALHALAERLDALKPEAASQAAHP